MPFSRQIYEALPDVIPVPAELKHHKAEVIILSLEAQPVKAKITLQAMLSELAAINALEPIEMECPPRVDSTVGYTPRTKMILNEIPYM